jgi:hypothetical protein
LFEFDGRHDAVIEIDCYDRGNVATRLVHATNKETAFERLAGSIERIRKIPPNCEIAVLAGAELKLRWRGLEDVSMVDERLEPRLLYSFRRRIAP